MEKVALTKNAIDKARGSYEERTGIVEVPELNELMGLEDGQTATVKIRQLDLNTYMESQQQQVDMFRNLVEGIVEVAIDREIVADHVAQQLGKATPSTKHRIRILQEGVVEPKMKQSDLIFLSKMFPIVVSRLYNQIIELTKQGGVKKNSVG